MKTCRKQQMLCSWEVIALQTQVRKEERLKITLISGSWERKSKINTKESIGSGFFFKVEINKQKKNIGQRGSTQPKVDSSKKHR